MTVSFDLQEGVGVIGIDDGNKNVINHDVLDELEAAWAQAESDASAVLIKGRPGAFCAGYDIKVMTGGDPEASAKLGSRGGRLATKIYGSGKPVVGLAQGHAFTIGLVWMACCDVGVVEQGPYKFGMTEVALGVPLNGWALEPFKLKLNPSHKTAALLHSTVYPPAGACEAGFFDTLAEEGTGLDMAFETAARLAQLPADAYAKTKQALRKDALEVMSANLGV